MVVFPFMCATNKGWITELTLIHKNIRSVGNSHAQELTLDIENYWSVWSQTYFDLTDKNNNTSFEGLTAILVIMSVSTFKTAVILYISLQFVLLVEEREIPRENHWTVVSHWKLYHTSPWAGFEVTLVVIGTDCIGNCKSNCHTITTTTAPVYLRMTTHMM